MSYAERHVVEVTTIADGSATAYSDTITGKISQIRYVKADFASGVDFTITSEATGETIWTQLDVNASLLCTITPANNTGAALLCVIAITVPQILPSANPPA